MTIESSFLASLLPLFLAFAFTAVVCRIGRWLGETLGLLDDPARKQHSRHERPTPLIGGLAILTPLILFCFFSGLWSDPETRPAHWQLAPVFASSVAVMMVLGMLDDRYHLSACSRLIIAGMSFLALVIFQPVFRVEQFSLPLFSMAIPVTLGWLAIPFTVLCLVALANAVNMADGRNGLVIGMSLIWTLAFISLSAEPYPVALLALFASLLAGFACNMRGQMFLGDGGTYGLAAAFGLAAVWFHYFEGSQVSTAQIGVLFLVPMLDMVRLIAARLRRGVSPLSADHAHLHHYLDDWIGWSRGLPVYLGLVALPVAIAYTSPMWGGEALVLGTALYFLLFNMARVQVRLRRERQVV